MTMFKELSITGMILIVHNLSTKPYFRKTNFNFSLKIIKYKVWRSTAYNAFSIGKKSV